MEKGGPYPQIILPQFGGFWIEDVEALAASPSSSECSFCGEEDEDEGMSPGEGHSYRLESNITAHAYRKHFLGKEHMNFYCTGSSIGNLIMSLKHEETEGQEFLRIMFSILSMEGQAQSSPILSKLQELDLLLERDVVHPPKRGVFQLSKRPRKTKRLEEECWQRMSSHQSNSSQTSIHH